MQPIQIIEVGPRDGLQNETGFVPTATKIAFVEALARAGLREIEVSAFVSPRWVPQLADADLVFAGMQRQPGVCYSALVPNLRGFDRAMAAGVDKIAVLCAASESFNRRNLNSDIAATLAHCGEVLQRSPLPARGYVSTAFHCPYEGPIAPAAVVPMVERLLQLGCCEISLGDTIGLATADDVERLLTPLLARFPAAVFAMHMHDTKGRAVANCQRADAMGVHRFDSCVRGFGGCPYAPGDHGNLATEDLARAFPGRVDLDLDALEHAAAMVHPHFGRHVAG